VNQAFGHRRINHRDCFPKSSLSLPDIATFNGDDDFLYVRAQAAALGRVAHAAFFGLARTFLCGGDIGQGEPSVCTTKEKNELSGAPGLVSIAFGAFGLGHQSPHLAAPRSIECTRLSLSDQFL